MVMFQASGGISDSFVLQQIESMSQEEREGNEAHRLLSLAASQMIAGRIQFMMLVIV
jgi:hypothetical protein